MPTATARLGGAAWRDWAALGPARRISSQRWYFPHRPSRRRPRGPRQAAASSWTGAWFVLMYLFVSSKEGADFLSGRCTFPKSNSEERIPARNTCVCPNNKIETEISGRKRASRSTGKCLWSPFQPAKARGAKTGWSTVAGGRWRIADCAEWPVVGGRRRLFHHKEICYAHRFLDLHIWKRKNLTAGNPKP